jgi:membrane peptidoglycan carboxypeptidase
MVDGPEKVLDTAVAMGVPRDARDLEPVTGIALGSAIISPVDMANGYGTIAEGGMEKDWYVVESVADSDDTTLSDHDPDATPAISADVAADTSYALQQVTEVGTGTNAGTIGRPVAGKTGTATDDEGHVRSSWFVGYTPQLSTAVMYVRGNGQEPLDGYLPTFYGGEYPARTWASLTEGALQGAPVIEFPEPAFVEATNEEHVPLPPPPPEPSPVPSPTKRPKPTRPPEPSPTPTETPLPTPTETPTEPVPTEPCEGILCDDGNGNGNGSPSPTPGQPPPPPPE